MFLTSNRCFQLKYESSIDNIAFSSESHFAWIRWALCRDQALLTNENSPKQYIMRGQQKIDFFNTENVVMDYALVF